MTDKSHNTDDFFYDECEAVSSVNVTVVIYPRMADSVLLANVMKESVWQSVVELAYMKDGDEINTLTCKVDTLAAFEIWFHDSLADISNWASDFC